MCALWSEAGLRESGAISGEKVRAQVTADARSHIPDHCERNARLRGQFASSPKIDPPWVVKDG